MSGRSPENALKEREYLTFNFKVDVNVIDNIFPEHIRCCADEVMEQSLY